ncbi:MAG: trehalase family glycosidase [Thiotrichales bacterium]|nr:trehalase family glycosidase [Thiotrichales bacterium]
MTGGDRGRGGTALWEPAHPGRRFDTWDVDHPTALVHLPSGLRVHLCAYSDRAGAFTRFPAGSRVRLEPRVRLGPRTLDGEAVDLAVTHEGTGLGLRFERTGADTARVRWWTEHTGEWGLRFWVVIALEATAFEGAADRVLGWSDPSAIGLRWSAGGVERCAGVLGARPPLLVTSHPDLAALAHEYETHGYWYLGSRGAGGPLLALRYNLEEMPENCVAVGIGPDPSDAAADTAAAVERARAAIVPVLAGPASGPGDERPAPGREPGVAGTRGPLASHGSGHSETSGGTGDPAHDDPPDPVLSSPPASPYSRRPAILVPPASPPAARPPLHTGRYDGALDAIRDVIGWNTVYDPVNRRPYTALSRNWSSVKFGGFGLWLDDMLYHALLAGILDPDLARENLRAVFAGRTGAGNLPCLLTGRDAWVDRSQPPIGAFVVWVLYQRGGERRLLAEAWETLLANHEWWWRERDGNGNGLLEYGTSPVGDGLYRGTALAARDESSMDNSPVHDEAVLVPECHTLDCEDVGLNSLLALDGEMLALMAAELGHAGEAQRLDARARALAARIGETLWDPQRQVFANRLWSGRFVASIAPTSFYPLLAGAASPVQARALLAWLADPGRFGGWFALPSVSRDDPAFEDNVYWRGRIWPPLNFLVYQGLRRYGFDAEATALARGSYALFAGPWRESRHCAENYGAKDGAVTDQPDTDTFYGWGALMPALAVAEVCDVSPWDGWSIVHTGDEVALGPLRGPCGWVRCEARAGIVTVHVDDRPVLRTNVRGRFRHLRLEAGSLHLELPPPESASGERQWIELPGVATEAVTTARLHETPGPHETPGRHETSGRDLGATAGTGGARIDVSDRPIRPCSLTLAWRR